MSNTHVSFLHFMSAQGLFFISPRSGRLRLRAFRALAPQIRLPVSRRRIGGSLSSAPVRIATAPYE